MFEFDEQRYVGQTKQKLYLCKYDNLLLGNKIKEDHQQGIINRPCVAGAVLQTAL